MFHDDDTLDYLDNYNKKTKDRTTSYKEAGKITTKRENKKFITDTENYEYASFVDRLLATLIDSVILVIPLTIIESTYTASTRSITAGTTLGIILPLIVTILFWTNRGATPGKMLMNMYIIDEQTKGKMSVTQSIIRYIGYLPSMFIFCFGFIWIAIDEKNQAWHDKMAGTIVVKRKKSREINF